MKNISVTFFILICSGNLFAQNVGIGTSAPLTRLHIALGSSGVAPYTLNTPLAVENNGHTYINILTPDVFESGILFGNASNVVSGGIIYGNSANRNGFQFRTNNNITRMAITDNGNIGIGVTNPNAPLAFAPSLGKKITLYPGATGDVGMGVQGNLLQIYSDHPNADIAFGYDQAGTLTERMRIKGNGNVGIGTADPNASALLDISSSSKGFLPPRMTLTERNGISSPATGLMVYCTDCSPAGPYWYSGSSWTSSTSTSTYTIGQSAHGGIVFWVDDSGQHGLVAATEDLWGGAGIQWWWSGPMILCNRLRNNGIYSGRWNTDSVIARHPTIATYAAGACAAYLGGGYGDWYLPSLGELTLLFHQRGVVGGFANDWYWSSTEGTFDLAYRHFFGTFSTGPGTKTSGYRVRPIRSF